MYISDSKCQDDLGMCKFDFASVLWHTRKYLFVACFCFIVSCFISKITFFQKHFTALPAESQTKHWAWSGSRPSVKSAYQKINVLLSQAKHMLWVLKGTVSMRRFFWAPKTYVKSYGLENIYNFTLYLTQCGSKLFFKKIKYIWAVTWDFKQCGMWDQQRLRSACACAQSDQNLC